MPIMISTPFQGQKLSNRLDRQKNHKPIRDKNFDRLYRDKYPNGVNLRPGFDFHDALVAEIVARARESEREMSKRHPKWDEIDKSLTAFIPQDDAEKAIKDKDIRKPTSIVVPESYATLETFVTYMMTIYGDQPMFRYIGTGPEDTVGAILLEKVVNLQVQKKQALLSLQEHWRDGFAYGFGVVTIDWVYEMGRKTGIQDTVQHDPVTGERIVLASDRVPVDTVKFEGSVLSSIDPRKYLPDPNVSIFRPQDAEFIGWLDDGHNFMQLLREENQPGTLFFNTRYLRDMMGRSSIYAHQTNARNPEDLGVQIDSGPKTNGGNTQPVDRLWMYIDLIPSEWQLGKGDLPEKWLFCVANDEVIISAGPMDNHHDMYPVSVCAPEAGGHELTPVSRVEIMHGLQGIANFQLNARVEEQMRFLKNHFVVDPLMVHMPDVKSNQGIIRTRQPSWGRGVDNGIMQLKMQDITSNHMGDLNQVLAISRSATAAVDSAQGIQRNRGERVTATEFDATRSSALSRIQRAAQTISLQSMGPLASMYAFHTQQYMTQETWVKMGGESEDVLRTEFGLGDEVQVSPFDLDINFDVLAHDGSISGGESAQGWIDYLQVAAGIPGLLEQMDPRRVGTHIARLLGNKNPQDFLSKQPVAAQVVPDEAVQDPAASGLLPVEEAAQL
jgi:hypothetical protein